LNTHWNAFCGLSVVHFMAYPECQNGGGPMLKSIERIALDDFFSAIEVSSINDPEIRRQAARIIEEAHMQVLFGAHPIILGRKVNLNSLDNAERAVAQHTLEPYIEQAAEIGARDFVVLSGPDPGRAHREAAEERLVESLLSLCQKARLCGMRIILETFDRRIDKKALIGPVEAAAAIARKVREQFEDFGLLYDMGHMGLLDEKPPQALTTIKPYLAHVHLGNCVKIPGRPSFGDTHPRFGFPGGENDVLQVADFLESLFEIQYLREDLRSGPRPLVGFEIRPQPGEASNLILANIKRTWNEGWFRARLHYREQGKEER
jgi:sugar phosphate isomerase/epimerase